MPRPVRRPAGGAWLPPGPGRYQRGGRRPSGLGRHTQGRRPYLPALHRWRRANPAAGLLLVQARAAAGRWSLTRAFGGARPSCIGRLPHLAITTSAAAGTMTRLFLPGRAQGAVPLAGRASGRCVLRYRTTTASFGGRCVVEVGRANCRFCFRLLFSSSLFF